MNLSASCKQEKQGDMRRATHIQMDWFCSKRAVCVPCSFEVSSLSSCTGGRKKHKNDGRSGVVAVCKNFIIDKCKYVTMHEERIVW